MAIISIYGAFCVVSIPYTHPGPLPRCRFPCESGRARDEAIKSEKKKKTLSPPRLPSVSLTDLHNG